MLKTKTPVENIPIVATAVANSPPYSFAYAISYTGTAFPVIYYVTAIYPRLKEINIAIDMTMIGNAVLSRPTLIPVIIFVA